jgi:hypothetical protein
MSIQNNPQETTNVKTKSGETVAVSGNVGINAAANIVKVENEILPGGAKKSLTVDGSVIVINDVAGGVSQPLVVGGTVKLDQTTAGANHTELVDASGNPIGLTANPLVVSPGTSFPIVNTVGDVLDVEIKSGANTASVDVNGKLAVNINPGGAVPSVTASLTSISTSDKLNVKTTGADTVAVTGSVNIGTMPPITISDVGILTTANTIKIDQANAGANHIQLADSTNASHVARVSNNGSVHTVITNDNASAVPTTITGTPNVNATIQNASIPVTGTFFQATQPISGNVGITGNPTVNINQATAGANHVEIVDSGGVVNQATNPLYTSTVLRDGANQAVIDGNGVLSVKFPLTQNVNVANTPNVNVSTLPSVKIDQATADANHVEIVNSSGTANSAAFPLFTKAEITNTSVSVTASSNLPVQGTVAISTINGIAPSIDASGNLQIEIAGTGNTVGLSTSANEVKINQTTPGANHVEIVNSAGAVNGAANPLFTSTVVSSDVTTLNKAVWAIGDFTSLSKTHLSNYFNAVANSTTVTVVSGISGYRLRLDKIFIHAETNLSSCVHTDTFTLRSQGSTVRDIHVFRGVSTVTTGFVYDFIPPDGGLLLEDGASLSIFNNNMSAGTPGFNMQVTLFYQFV